MYCQLDSSECELAEDFISISLRFQDTNTNRFVEQDLLTIKIDSLSEKNKWEQVTTEFNIDTETKRNFQVNKQISKK